MYKYYGNKQAIANEIMAAMPVTYSEYLELCGGIASVARLLVPPSVERTVVEKDPGLSALLRVTRDHPIELAAAMEKIPYSRDSFEYAAAIRDNGYVGCDDLMKAIVKKVLTEMSFNAACNSYRDLYKRCNIEQEDYKIQYLIGGRQYHERYYRKILPDVLNMSSELKGIKIIEDDFMNHLDKLNNDDLFVTIDPPYRPAVRQAKKLGYDFDMTNEDHHLFMQKLMGLSKNGRLGAKIMIFGYVEEDLKNDLYCRALLPLGFRLIFLKEVYLPRIVRGNMDKRKTKKYECIFVNYEDTVEQDFVTPDRMFDCEKVFGDSDISDETA